MNFRNLSVNRFLITCIVFLFVIGCSPSTNAQRYGTKKNKTTTKAKTTRYNSKPAEEKPNQITKTIAVPDSTDDEFDEAPPESVIDKKKFIADYRNYINPDIPLSFREEMLLQVIKFLDTPYKYGGTSENGIDCSGFTKEVYLSAVNMELPRSAREQYGVGENVDEEDLEFGDLVFFNTTRRSFPGHVGLYIGDNQFIHASRKLGVTISSLEETYYKKRFVGARRVDLKEL